MSTFSRALLIAVLLPIAAAAQAPQDPPPSQNPETKKIPDDSVEIATTGCLKGRVFTATQPREDFMRRGPNVTGRSFRLNGPRKLIDLVKTHDGDLVEIVGLVRKNDLRDTAPGARVGNTRVVIGAPRSGDPMQSARVPISEGIAVMDATSIRYLDDRCPIVMR
jgi:hypothetical protein